MPLTRLSASPPESYVVRIYRRSARGAGRIAGTVEIVSNATERSFAGARELMQILSGPVPSANAFRKRSGEPE